MLLPVFLINLDRSPDRLAFMQAEANRIGLKFERVPAVDRTAVPDDLRAQFLAPDGSPAGPLSPGEVGCYASHLTVHQRVVREGLPCAVVLEDDARLTPHLMDVVPAAVTVAPEDWDLIHLSAVVNRAVYAMADLPGGCHLVRYMRPPRGTAGYIISRSGAAKMLAPAPRRRPIDVDLKLAYERNLDVLGVYPPPVIWGNHFPSEIWSKSGDGLQKRTRPSAKETFRGHLYVARKLGLSTYLQCRLATLRRRRRSEVPIVR
jgi:glycosyl transferase family 25